MARARDPDAASVPLREPPRGVLEQLLGEPVLITGLKHKPGRRSTSRAVGPYGSAIVKVYASGRASIVAARLAALSTGPAEPLVPRSLLVDARRHLLVLSEVPGAPLREALLAGDHASAARAGVALARWHTFWRAAPHDPALRPHSAERELELLLGRARSAPAHVRAAVEAAAPPLAGEWSCSTAVHRDLYEEQIIVGDRVGLIDLDDAALGPPELDLGNLAAHCDLLALRSARPAPLWSLAVLVTAYASTGARLDEALLARCHQLALLRLVCIHGETRLLEAMTHTGRPEITRRRSRAVAGDCPDLRPRRR